MKVSKQEKRILKLAEQKADYNTFMNAVYDDPESIFLASKYINLTENTLREFEDQLKYLLGNEKSFSDDFFREYQDKIRWESLSHEININSKILKEFCDKVDWIKIIYNNKLKEDVIEFYITHILVDRHYNESYIIPLISHQSLSVEFLDKYWNVFKPFANLISKWQKLTEEFIERHKDELDWDHISSYQDLSEQFMREHESYINWNIIHQTRSLSRAFVMEIYNEFFNNISYTNECNYKLTQTFIERYYDVFKWDWVVISRYVDLNSVFILKYKDKLHLDDIAKFQKYLGEEFVETHLKNYISEYIANHKVSVNFIRKHVDKIKALHWLDVIKTQQFDETLLREFKDYIVYDISSINTSWDFTREFSDNIIWKSKIVFTVINEKEIEEFKDEVDWEDVCKYEELSESFMEKYAEKFNWKNIWKFQSLSDGFYHKHIKKFK